MQWRNEILAHTDGLDVHIWQGAFRVSDIEELQKHDVVGPSHSYYYRIEIQFPFQ